MKKMGYMREKPQTLIVNEMLVKIKEEFGMTPGLQFRLMNVKSHNFRDGKFKEKTFFGKIKYICYHLDKFLSTSEF